MRPLALLLLALPLAAQGQTKITTRQARTAAPVAVDLRQTSSGQGVSKAFAKADHGHPVAVGPQTLPTCTGGPDGLEGQKRWPVGTGGTSGVATKSCRCESNGSGAYSWRNLTTKAVGTASSCP